MQISISLRIQTVPPAHRHCGTYYAAFPGIAKIDCLDKTHSLPKWFSPLHGQVIPPVTLHAQDLLQLGMRTL
ncbi:hypothetical protein BN2475_140064 [Paraburkholderia ribeironis]|uniref:Uncharacterized protein n=1 Tax=Paraburkholderia ribeironis TaxID=1247936 RepID=A0A1N7RSY3_9BURK|nr:hypothetical protein BN2475_140064 [Paraburkholderia ribeironis]